MTLKEWWKMFKAAPWRGNNGKINELLSIVFSLQALPYWGAVGAIGIAVVVYFIVKNDLR